MECLLLKMKKDAKIEIFEKALVMRGKGGNFECCTLKTQ